MSENNNGGKKNPLDSSLLKGFAAGILFSHINKRFVFFIINLLIILYCLINSYCVYHFEDNCYFEDTISLTYINFPISDFYWDQ